MQTYRPSADAPRFIPKPGTEGYTEVGPLLAWQRWQQGETLGPSGPLQTRNWKMGLEERGSDNHGPMLASAWLLRAAENGASIVDAYRALRAARDLFIIQREEGHRCKEFGGYSHFHYGAAATLAIAAKDLADDPLIGVEARVVWRYALDWWASELAILRLLRCPDGQILVVGSRQRPHEQTEPVFHEAFPALVAEMLDHRPATHLVEWLFKLVGFNAEGVPHETNLTHPDCGFGWLKPASARSAVCLRQVLAAIQLGALPLDLIRRAAEGRRPRIAGELGVGPGVFDGVKVADMKWLHGGPYQCYRSFWVDDGSRPATIVSQSLGGFGQHQSPSPRQDIPVLLHPDLPISALPQLPESTPAPSPKPDYYPKAWEGVESLDYVLEGGKVVFPARDLDRGEVAVIQGLLVGSPPGGPFAWRVFERLVGEGIVVPRP